MPTSIYDSFQEKLLDLELTSEPVKNNYREFSDTESAIKSKAPYCWVYQPHKTLTDVAKTARDLVEHKIQHPLPLVEETHHLQTQSDVLRASSLYLLHPVNVTATRLLRAKGGQHSGGILECGSGRSATQSNPTYIKWVFKRNSGEAGLTIAVLEFKNTKMVHKNDFTPALIVEETQLKGSLTGTRLRRNAVWLAKHSKKYSENLNTPDVAVFDWDAMFVFDFNGPEKSMPYGVWFSESDPECQSDPTSTFRSVLLGFLVRAMMRQGIIPQI